MNNDLKIPMYVTIVNSIIDRIQKRELEPGEKIPSENEIIREYNVSNTTARKVLQEIEGGGWAVKVRGKGTFVKDFVVERAATKILSFTKNMRDQGLAPTTKLLKKELLDTDVLITVSGKRYTIRKPVCKIQRLRFANDIPMMVETRYISQLYCPDIMKFNLEDSLYDIYQQEYHLSITKIEQDLSAVFLNEESKINFKVKDDIPGIKVDGVTFCGKDMILEGEESIYRGDKYKFSVQAVP
ncbi:MAG: GntR family transcriptional regulator [Bacteroidales bacterium]|nr:GntR family transcriptional regulator [Bacteroidales bacterium]